MLVLIVFAKYSVLILNGSTSPNEYIEHVKYVDNERVLRDT